MLKKFVRWNLERYVKKYFKKHSPKLIAVVGSVGKTSTKLAIATVLSERYRIRTQNSNHNTDMSVPLGILGVEYPSDVHSIASWLAVFKAARLRIKTPQDVDVIIQELGTDAPGDIQAFGMYLKPDITVITSVSAEHMEFFGTLEKVAAEELSAAKFSQLTIVNRDDVDGKYSKYAETNSISTYGLSSPAEYRIELDPASPLDGRMGKFYAPEWEPLSVNIQLVGDHSVKAVVAAAAVGAKLGLTAQQIAVGVAKITPVPGRMSILRGMNESIIIDDSYNSSPLAATAAIETLYGIEAPQRIVILGSMNELGSFTAEAHRQVASLCDPTKLEWVVTVGEIAQTYLAPFALEKGCQVKSFKSPYEAGGFVHSVVRPGGIVLVKGSQNNVFSEEAVKVLLRDADDKKYLVRQDDVWMKKKQQFFETINNMDQAASEDV